MSNPAIDSKNIGNIKGTYWRGVVGGRMIDGATVGNEYAVFDTYRNGVRAAVINAHTKIYRDKYNTWHGLASIWTATQSHWNHYGKMMSEAAGHRGNHGARPDFASLEQVAGMVLAMQTVESGKFHVSDDDIVDGIADAYEYINSDPKRKGWGVPADGYKGVSREEVAAAYLKAKERVQNEYRNWNIPKVGDANKPMAGAAEIAARARTRPAETSEQSSEMFEEAFRLAAKQFQNLDPKDPAQLEKFNGYYARVKKYAEEKGVSMSDNPLATLGSDATDEQRAAAKQGALEALGKTTEELVRQGKTDDKAPLASAPDATIASAGREYNEQRSRAAAAGADDEDRANTQRNVNDYNKGGQFSEEMFLLGLLLLAMGRGDLAQMLFNSIGGGGGGSRGGGPTSSPGERGQYRNGRGNGHRQGYSTNREVEEKTPMDKTPFGSGLPAGRTNIIPEHTHHLPFDPNGPLYQQFFLPTRDGKGIVILANKQTKKMLFAAEMPAHMAGNALQWGTREVADRDMQGYWESVAYVVGSKHPDTKPVDLITNVVARGNKILQEVAALDPNASDYQAKLDELKAKYPGLRDLPAEMLRLNPDKSAWKDQEIAQAAPANGKVDISRLAFVGGLHHSRGHGATSGTKGGLDFSQDAVARWKNFVQEKEGAIPHLLFPYKADGMYVTTHRGQRADRHHDGVDVSNGTGRPYDIVAPADGVVLGYASLGDGWNSRIAIGLSDGRIAVVRHVNKAQGLQVGATIKQGELIGRSVDPGGGMHGHIEMFHSDGRHAPMDFAGVGDISRMRWRDTNNRFGFSQSQAAIEAAKAQQHAQAQAAAAPTAQPKPVTRGEAWAAFSANAAASARYADAVDALAKAKAVQAEHLKHVLDAAKAANADADTQNKITDSIYQARSEAAKAEAEAKAHRERATQERQQADQLATGLTAEARTREAGIYEAKIKPEPEAEGPKPRNILVAREATLAGELARLQQGNASAAEIAATQTELDVTRQLLRAEQDVKNTGKHLEMARGGLTEVLESLQPSASQPSAVVGRVGMLPNGDTHLGAAYRQWSVARAEYMRTQAVDSRAADGQIAPNGSHVQKSSITPEMLKHRPPWLDAKLRNGETFFYGLGHPDKTTPTYMKGQSGFMSLGNDGKVEHIWYPVSGGGDRSETQYNGSVPGATQRFTGAQEGINAAWKVTYENGHRLGGRIIRIHTDVPGRDAASHLLHTDRYNVGVMTINGGRERLIKSIGCMGVQDNMLPHMMDTFQRLRPKTINMLNMDKVEEWRAYAREKAREEAVALELKRAEEARQRAAAAPAAAPAVAPTAGPVSVPAPVPTSAPGLVVGAAPPIQHGAVHNPGCGCPDCCSLKDGEPLPTLNPRELQVSESAPRPAILQPETGSVAITYRKDKPTTQQVSYQPGARSRVTNNDGPSWVALDKAGNITAGNNIFAPAQPASVCKTAILLTLSKTPGGKEFIERNRSDLTRMMSNSDDRLAQQLAAKAAVELGLGNGMTAFTARMQKVVEDLGLKGTQFTPSNPNGGGVSNAYDMARMTQILAQDHPEVKGLFRAQNDEFAKRNVPTIVSEGNAEVGKVGALGRSLYTTRVSSTDRMAYSWAAAASDGSAFAGAEATQAEIPRVIKTAGDAAKQANAGMVRAAAPAVLGEHRVTVTPIAREAALPKVRVFDAGHGPVPDAEKDEHGHHTHMNKGGGSSHELTEYQANLLQMYADGVESLKRGVQPVYTNVDPRVMARMIKEGKALPPGITEADIAANPRSATFHHVIAKIERSAQWTERNLPPDRFDWRLERARQLQEGKYPGLEGQRFDVTMYASIHHDTHAEAGQNGMTVAAHYGAKEAEVVFGRAVAESMASIPVESGKYQGTRLTQWASSETYFESFVKNAEVRNAIRPLYGDSLKAHNSSVIQPTPYTAPGKKEQHWTVTRGLGTIPGLLFEDGFASSPEDRAKIADPEYRKARSQVRIRAIERAEHLRGLGITTVKQYEEYIQKERARAGQRGASAGGMPSPFAEAAPANVNIARQLDSLSLAWQGLIMQQAYTRLREEEDAKVSEQRDANRFASILGTDVAALTGAAGVRLIPAEKDAAPETIASAVADVRQAVGEKVSGGETAKQVVAADTPKATETGEKKQAATSATV